jgi:L-lysine exporter family protein LysE/ArgO
MFSFLQGLGMGASLVIAIGAQNAFVLRQGILREHRFPVALLSSLLDALLILLGVAGFGALIAAHPALIQWASIAGAVYLFGFGLFCFRSAFQDRSLKMAATQSPKSLGKVLLLALSFSVLNPHVYIDTVIVLGGISTAFVGEAKFLFGLGAMLASFVWFFSLIYGASLLRRFFEKPKAWRILDSLIGMVMWSIAITLITKIL